MRRSSNGSRLDPPQQACTSCKAQKRKCNKAFPQCSSCSKKNLSCTYLARGQVSDAAPAPDRASCESVVNDDKTVAPSVDYATILFLDPDLLRHGPVDLCQPAAPVPARIVELLGDMNAIHATAAQYFDHMHQWMPFISKKRFQELDLHSSSLQTRPELVILLLALKLITTVPPQNPRNPRTSLYHATKDSLRQVECSSILSLSVLQAGILVAMYELGHAIYPAAFLSIGAIARYAYTLGINVSKRSITKRALTLVEVEERKRVWWAIVILDRFVSIGCPGRPYATVDPAFDDLLPTADAAWDQGIVNLDDSATLSSPMIGNMSKFALLCQAARLLGQVLQFTCSEQADHNDAWIQLDRTLQSMVAASLDVDLPDHDQIAFVYSTLVALHIPWFDPSRESNGTKDHAHYAKASIQKIVATIEANLVDGQCFLGRTYEDMSPWGIFFAYRISVAYMGSNEGSPGLSRVMKSLKETLLEVDARWNAAGTYLQLLEAQQIMKKL